MSDTSFLEQAIATLERPPPLPETIDEPDAGVLPPTLGEWPTVTPKERPKVPFLEQAIAAAEDKLRDQIVADVALLPKARHVASQFILALGQMAGGTAKAYALAQHNYRELAKTLVEGLEAGEYYDEDVRNLLAYRLGEQTQQFFQRHFKGDPRLLHDFWLTDLPSAGGYMAGFLAGGYATAAAKGPALLATVGLGASVESTSLFEQAVAGGATDEDALLAASYGVPIGATEVVPVARILRRFNQASGGQIARGIGNLMRQGTYGSVENAAQEWFQTEAGKQALRQIGLKESQLVEDSNRAAAAGGIVGFIASLIATGAGMRAAGRRPGLPEPVGPPEKQAAPFEPTPEPEVAAPRPALDKMTKEQLLSPEGAKALRQAEPEIASQVAVENQPSRRQRGGFGEMRRVAPRADAEKWSTGDRARFAELLRAEQLSELEAAEGKVVTAEGPVMPRGEPANRRIRRLLAEKYHDVAVFEREGKLFYDDLNPKPVSVRALREVEKSLGRQYTFESARKPLPAVITEPVAEPTPTTPPLPPEAMAFRATKEGKILAKAVRAELPESLKDQVRVAKLGSKKAVEAVGQTIAKELGTKGMAKRIEAAAVPAVQAMMPQAPPAELPSTGEAVGIPVVQEPGVRPTLSTYEITQAAEKLFGVPVRTGRIRGKAAGIYKVHPEVVRRKAKFGGDLGVLVHEVSHHIDKTEKVIESMPDEVKAEVAALDYQPDKARPGEGFAEFVRHYLTDETAPDLASYAHNWFTRNWLPQHPETAENLAKLRRMIDEYRQAGAPGRALSQLTPPGALGPPPGVGTLAWFRGVIGDAWHEIYRAMVDKGLPLDQYQKELRQKGYEVPEGGVPYDLFIAMTRIGPSWANKAVAEGVFAVTRENWGKRLGPSLVEALGNVPHSEIKSKQFQIYALARHTVETDAKGKPTGLHPDDAKWIVRNYGTTEQRARWEDAATKLTEFNNALILMMADAGRLDAESAARIIGEYKTYIPLHRMRSKLGALRERLGKRIVDMPSPVKRRKGSALPVVDPVYSSIQRAIRFYSEAAQQQVATSIIDAAEAVGGMGKWVEEVPANVQAQAFTVKDALREMRKAALEDATGIELADLEANMEMFEALDPDREFYIFKPIFRGEKGKSIAIVQREGKSKMYQFDPHFYSAITGMDAIKMPWFLDMTAGKLTRAAKLGITGLSPDFAARNIFRDANTYLMQRQHALGPKGLVAPPKLMASYVYTHAMKLAGKEGDPLVKMWEDHGGPLATYLGMDMRAVKGRVNEVLADSTKQRALLVARHPIHALREVINTSEVGPRLAEFEAALARKGHTRETIRRGKTPSRDEVMAALISSKDVTVNFQRSGWLSQWVNQFDLFFNPAIQGADKFARTWKVDPRLALMRSSILAAITLGYWWLRKDDDDYVESEPWLKYGFWTIADEDGKPVIRIPRGFEWGWTVSAGVEALADALYRTDPDLFSEYAGSAAENLVPNLMPHIVDPLLEVAVNKQFGDRPVVPKAVEGRLPKDQYTFYNTALMRKVGEFLGISPAQLEHLAQGYTGGLYRRLYKVGEAGLGEFESWADVPFVGGLVIRKDYAKSVGDFYEELDKARRAYVSAKHNDSMTGELAMRYRFLNMYAGVLSDLRKQLDGVTDRDERFEVEKRIVGLARAALGREELERYR